MGINMAVPPLVLSLLFITSPTSRSLFHGAVFLPVMAITRYAQYVQKLKPRDNCAQAATLSYTLAWNRTHTKLAKHVLRCRQSCGHLAAGNNSPPPGNQVYQEKSIRTVVNPVTRIVAFFLDS